MGLKDFKVTYISEMGSNVLFFNDMRFTRFLRIISKSLCLLSFKSFLWYGHQYYDLTMNYINISCSPSKCSNIFRDHDHSIILKSSLHSLQKKSDALTFTIHTTR